MTRRKHNILILEDDIFWLATLKILLRYLPYTITTSSNGQDGLQYLTDDQSTISLVLSNINMPGLDGLEFLSIIKEDPKLMNIPVILQSAATVEEAQKGLALGADLFLRKPYGATDLYVALAQVSQKMIEYERSIRQVV